MKPRTIFTSFPSHFLIPPSIGYNSCMKLSKILSMAALAAAVLGLRAESNTLEIAGAEPATNATASAIALANATNGVAEAESSATSGAKAPENASGPADIAATPTATNAASIAEAPFPGSVTNETADVGESIRAETEMKVVALPAPGETAGKSVMQAIRERQSQRNFSARELSRQQLADVLWAAAGITRDDGKRTAGSTCDWRAVELYAVLPDGIYFYDAASNTLEQVADGDFRRLAGKQDFVADAPLNLLYVGDFNKMKIGDKARQHLCFGCDIGLMSENVYLYCASEGLATVVRGSVENGPLADAMGLDEGKAVLMAQTVGYPRRKPLVVFYSRGGNTRLAAKAIAKATGADLYEIKTEKPYPADYQACVKQVADEIKAGTLPALAGDLPDFSKYGEIIVGGPVWWGRAALPVAAFLQKCDFTDKSVAFFVTHGGGGMAGAADDAESAAKIKFTATKAWRGNDAKSLGAEFTEWAKSVCK